jgi:hypothetical protein
MHIFEEEFCSDVDKYLKVASKEKVYVLLKNGHIAIISSDVEDEVMVKVEKATEFALKKSCSADDNDQLIIKILNESEN